MSLFKKITPTSVYSSYIVCIWICYFSKVKLIFGLHLLCKKSTIILSYFTECNNAFTTLIRKTELE